MPQHLEETPQLSPRPVIRQQGKPSEGQAVLIPDQNQADPYRLAAEIEAQNIANAPLF